MLVGIRRKEPSFSDGMNSFPAPGKVAVAFPERFGMHEGILGLKALGRGAQLEDSAIHHAADIGGGLIDVGDHFHHLNAPVLVFGEPLCGGGAGGDGIGIAGDLILPQVSPAGIGRGNGLVYLLIDGICADGELRALS